MFTRKQEKWAMVVVLAFLALALYVAAGVSVFGAADRSDDFRAGWIAAISMALCYQTGYRNILRNAGPLVFVVVFLLPTVLQLIGVAIRLVRLYS
ncbi:hypothetical protein [Lysobacter enzymogenes]|uniref:hypothetical protein n=1 Tax=Lysobacter enzymogenes TaxID=69 RepID=UPI0008998ABF|nr:hypothetical protein [Lysobacter enzymogenes]SDW55958.1 hypothetical protein SAMN05421681_102194 [Lysobacter enzymogenes]